MDILVVIRQDINSLLHLEFRTSSSRQSIQATPFEHTMSAANPQFLKFIDENQDAFIQRLAEAVTIPSYVLSPATFRMSLTQFLNFKSLWRPCVRSKTTAELTTRKYSRHDWLSADTDLMFTEWATGLLES